MLTSPDKGFASHESFGKYRFLAEIGYGGMSEIYLTVTQGGLAGFQKLVVLKLLRRDLAEDEEFRRMFLDEARVAARLNHPNVVQTYDVGEDHGRYYIAMEYLEGQTFERVRRARNSSKLFPLSMQIQMLSQVLSGLDYAHGLSDYDSSPISIVHRDATPSNVLITYDGQIKLIDFGIAKVLEGGDHTRVGVLKGKARYMAPEQISGEAIDRRADIYAVGVMLWETLAGKQIWSGLIENEVLRRSGVVPPLPAEAPPALQQIVGKAMAARPEDRYPTAEALRDELDRYVADHLTPCHEREIGAAVAELFTDERVRIRQVIDGQLKGGSAGTRLPAFRELRASSRSAEIPVATDASAGSGPSSQLAYENLPAPDTFPAPNRVRRQLAIGGIAMAVTLAIGIAVLLGSRGSPGAPPSRQGTTAAGAMATPPVAAASVQPAAPARSDQAPLKPRFPVRGVTDTTITLGMSAAFSGGSRELGNRMKLGLETAFAVVNDAGGVAGRQIKLLALDDGYEGVRALGNVRELIDERSVFALIGNVGTPTTQQALPYVLASKAILFGAFTGSGILRRDPPDRYVFNYRASYEEETARMVNYLVDVKKLPDRSIVVFAQNDGYGDAGFDGATKMLRRKGRDDELLRVGYERNTLNIDDAVNKVVEYHNATGRNASGDMARKHPVKAIIMVATYKAASRFIQRIRDHKIDTLLLNVSFVGSNSLADELRELGAGYAKGVIVTQVVPHYEASATGTLRFREALRKFRPDQQADFVSLEGFIVGELFAEGLRRTGRELDGEALIDTLEQLSGIDLGYGGSLGFSPSQHQASHRVWGTELDEHGTFHSIDME